MAFGITDLVNNIQESVSGLVNEFLGKNNETGTPTYHRGEAYYKAIQSEIKQENWSKLSFPYTFAVVNLKDATKNGGFGDFELPLAPQSITQKETPAISIRPTQGGTTVNHGGIGYKTLNISGTTGIAPFRGDGGVNRKTGEAIFQPKRLKYKSGYEVFHHLRNWFRTYYEFKAKEGKNAKDYRLVFKNYKDGEFLIIELTDFEMDRQAARPFLYDYKLEFKVLAHYAFNTPKSEIFSIETKLDDALTKINTARGVFLRTQGILRQIESTYDASVLEPMRQSTLALKALLGVPLVAADVGSRTIVNTVSTAKALIIQASEVAKFASLGIAGQSQTKAEIDQLVDKRIGTLAATMSKTKKDIEQKGSIGLSSMGAILTQTDVGQFPSDTVDATAIEQSNAAELPRSFYENSIADLVRVKENAEDFFNLGSSDYDSLFDRTSTLNADFAKVVTDEEYDMLFAFNEAISGLYLLLSTTDLFKSNFDEKIQDMVDRFGGQIELFANQAVKQIKLQANITLERIAQQELGDSNRWGEIVEVNGMKAPYISEDPNESRDGVYKVGSNILVPIPVLNGFSQVPVGKENKLTHGMSEMERSLGVDLRVDKNFDLVLTGSGDLEMVAGADNMAQGILLKLSYEPGELMRYPQMGAGLLPGRKFPSLDDIKDRIVNTLFQDSRIESVDDLSLIRDGGGLSINFNLKVKQVDIPIPIKIKI